MARRELRKALYGPDSLYARTPTPAGVASISTADLAAFVSTWERPDAAVLGISGDFDSEGMMQVGGRVVVPLQPAAPLPPAALHCQWACCCSLLASPTALLTYPSSPPPPPQLVTQTLEAWQPAPGQPQAPPAVPTSPGPSAPSGPRALLVPLAQARQASVLLGEPGVALSDPDVAALDVLASVLNSFGGRLFDEVSEPEGGRLWPVWVGMLHACMHRGGPEGGGDEAVPG